MTTQVSSPPPAPVLPEVRARRAVAEQGGSLLTNVPDLLLLFDRDRLTPDVRREIAGRLAAERLATHPDMALVEPHQLVEVLKVPRPSTASPVRRSGRRSWKDLAIVGVVAGLAIAALSMTMGSDHKASSRPAVPAQHEVVLQPAKHHGHARAIARHRAASRGQARARRARLAAIRRREARALRAQRRRHSRALKRAAADFSRTTTARGAKAVRP